MGRDNGFFYIDRKKRNLHETVDDVPTLSSYSDIKCSDRVTLCVFTEKCKIMLVPRKFLVFLFLSYFSSFFL